MLQLFLKDEIPYVISFLFDESLEAFRYSPGVLGRLKK